jgi:hypothetical protein
MSEKYVFTPNADEGFLPLSRTKTGRLVRKQILKTGPLNYPGIKGGSVELTNDMFDQIVSNFDSKVCDIVQFPMADNNNAHSEDPLRNAGEVVQLKHEGDSLYAYIDVRKPEVVQGIEEKTVIGASAMLALDYTDTRTGKKAGPTLLHVAGTNRPHVLELDDFEVIAASVDSKSEAVLLTSPSTPDSEERSNMSDLTVTEMLEVLKKDHGIDVPALQAQAADTAGVAELSAKLSDALESNGLIKLSNGETAKAEDLVLAVGQLVEDKAELSNRVETLEKTSARKEAEVEVDKLVSGGYIAEATREAYVELKLSAPDTFTAIIPEQPILKLSGEAIAFAPTDEGPSDDVQAEIDRITTTVV